MNENPKNTIKSPLSSIAASRAPICLSSGCQLRRQSLLTRSVAARWLGVLSLVMCFHANSFAQANRIPGPIDNGQRFMIPGDLPPLAQSMFDQGPVDASFRLDRVTLVIKRSGELSGEYVE